MHPETSKPVPRATYRLQFTKDFGFAQAADLAGYLAELGISHVYASPYLRARPGSTHGYDIVSHTELNPELGTPESFDRMAAAFKRNGLGQILDFVPNHMGVGGADNPWWLDVLEWGPGSEYAGWFDIDWESDRRYLQNKLLVPLLGDQYGAVLESGGCNSNSSRRPAVSLSGHMTATNCRFAQPITRAFWVSPIPISSGLATPSVISRHGGRTSPDVPGS
jgi:(1->4)-alpha-D-glucan 1-alpha-D-glucosylmutase